MLDILLLGDELSKPQQSLQKSVNATLQSSNIKTQVIEAYRSEKTPKALLKTLASVDAFGHNLSGYGLKDYDARSYGLIMMELERLDSGVRSIASVQGALVMYPIWKYGSENQKDQWLKKLSTADAMGGFALTEPQGGSDPSAMETTATPKDGKWILNGKKTWITNGTFADIIVTWARTPDGIQGFIVPTKSKGVHLQKMSNKLSLRASETAEVEFKNVELDKEDALPLAKGLRTTLDCLNQARYGISWGVIGAAEACYEETFSYAQNRILFKTPLTHQPMVQAKFANMLTKIQQAKLLAYRLSELKDQNKIEPVHISMGKSSNVEMAINVARTCRDILGGVGILDSYETMRHMCNLETVSTYEGTHDIHLLIYGTKINRATSVCQKNLRQAFMKYIFVFTIVAMLSSMGQAQSAPEDGYQWKFLPIPVLFYTPETSLGYGGMLITSYQKADLPVSNIRVIISNTTQNQFNTNLHIDHNIGNRDYRIDLKLNYRIYPLKFYGIGPESHTEDDVEDYTPEIFEGWLYGEKKVFHHTYLAGGYYIDRYTLKEKQTDKQLTNSNITGNKGGTTSGLRLSLSYDSRDHRYGPKSGMLSEFQVRSFSKAFGSDFTYEEYHFNFRYFYSPTNSATIGTQTLITSIEGDPSFRHLAGFGGYKIMRGYYYKRFRDKKAVSQQVEWRQHIYKNFGGTVFAGIGQVSHDFSPKLITSMKTNYGFGVRYNVDKENRYNLRADLGFIPERGLNPSLYIAVFEAF